MQQPCYTIPNWIIEGIGVMGLLAIGGLWLVVRMMWGDYKKRHKIDEG